MTDFKYEIGSDNNPTISPSLKIPPVNGCQSSNVYYFGNLTRYLVLLISTICLSLNMSNSLALNFTIICMSPNEGSNSTNNLTTGPIYYFSKIEQSSLYLATPLGTLIGTIPITFLTTKFGMR